jgi:ABC-type Fe3+ transport system substrate-binding protein
MLERCIMELLRDRISRRAFLKASALGVGTAAAGSLGATSAAPTAAQTSSLVVYGWAGNWDLWFEDWAGQFEDETGVQLSYISGSGPQMRQRIISENAAESDVFIGTPGDSFSLASEGFLADIPWDELSNAEDVDPRFRFPNVGIWGYDLWEIGYNTTLVSGADVPKSWVDLSDPKYEGMLSMPDPSLDSNAWMWMTFEKAYGEEQAWDMLTKMFDNSVRLTTTPGEAERSVATGESAIAPLAMGNIMVAAGQAGGAVLGSPPEDGAFLMLNSISVMKNAPNKDNALKFVDFYFSPSVQNNIMNELGISIATNGTVELTNEDIAETGLGGSSVEDVLETAFIPDWLYWSELVDGEPRITTLLNEIQERVRS